MTPCPVCDQASVVDEDGCCIHCGAPREVRARAAWHRLVPWLVVLAAVLALALLEGLTRG